MAQAQQNRPVVNVIHNSFVDYALRLYQIISTRYLCLRLFAQTDQPLTIYFDESFLAGFYVLFVYLLRRRRERLVNNPIENYNYL